MSSQLKLSAYGALATIATSLSLLSVFASTAWLMPVVGAILIVAGSCALVRLSPLPSAFEPVTAALAVLLWITGLYARSKAHFGVIPGRTAFTRLGHVARSGFTEIHQLPTPAPAHHGLVMLTVVGVAAIALVVDLMTVTLRRAALAGLPLLALFTVCAATGHHGVGIFAFITSSIGYLWLLYADNRDKVSRWGAAVGSGSRARPASAWSTDASSAPAPASLGRQVGAVAISLGMVVPLFIPGLHTGINKHGTGGSGTGSGGGSVQTFDPIVRVGTDLASSTPIPVLRYVTTTHQPGYIRLTSLDQFNGRAFTEAQLTAPSDAIANESLQVSPPPPATSAPAVETTFTVSPQQAYYWLPVQATAVGVDVGDQWRYDPETATIFSSATTTAGIHYTERSLPNQPTSAQLSAAPKPTTGLEADLIAGVSPRVRALEKRITANATTRYDAAVDIQRYLTGPKFSYDTNISADNGPDPLGDFLLTTRRGFCQQYATAMAVLARLYGIPARVAVGFTRGKQQADDSWIVTTHDAHAWPELWFQGYGWMPFEPTPRGDGQAVTPGYANGVKPGKHHPQTGKPQGKAGGDLPPGQRPDLPAAGTNGKGGAGPALSGHHHRARDVGVIIGWLLLAVAIGLTVPGVARAITRRHRGRQMSDPALAPVAAWAELRDTSVDLGAPWDDGRSPRQVAELLRRHLDATPKTTDSLLRLARCEEESRYAPAPSASGTNLRYDVDIVRAALEESRTAAQRLRARLLPRSTLLTARGAVSHGLARFDRVGKAISPYRALLRTRARLARS